MDIKQELKSVIAKHKDDRLQTFDTNITAMAKDCLQEIERLESENQFLYGRLNMISDIIEDGRKKAFKRI